MAEDETVRRFARASCTATLLTLVAAAAAAGGDPVAPKAPPQALLTPLPDRGGVPAIVDMTKGPSEAELAHRARARRYTQQIRAIRHKHFGSIKVPAIRAEGIEQLAEFVDPAAYRPLLEELAREQDDVRLAILDHLTTGDDAGQAALAWVAIPDETAAMRLPCSLGSLSED